MNYHIIRSPESQGRPEKYIADAVANLLTKQIGKADSVFDHFAHGDEDPVNGADFYNLDPTVSMLSSAANAVQTMVDGDVVFVMDAQSPCTQIVRYLCLIKGITVKIAGLFHSSAYTQGDLFYRKKDAVYNEALTLEQLDVTMVATHYLAANLLKCMPRKQNIFVIGGLPMDHVPAMETTPFHLRDSVCVWPHRLAEDKGLSFMLKLAEYVPIRVLTPTPLDESMLRRLAAAGVDVRTCPTRERYFTQLAKAKVVLSTAHLETFGYAMMEGVAMGCLPFVPERACYVEQYHVRYRYPADEAEDILEWCTERLDELLSREQFPIQSPLKQTDNESTRRMVDQLLLLGQPLPAADQARVDTIVQGLCELSSPFTPEQQRRIDDYNLAP